jgi:hypothetical protein
MVWARGTHHIPNIEEDMEFTKVLIVKQKVEEIFPKSELG